MIVLVIYFECLLPSSTRPVTFSKRISTPTLLLENYEDTLLWVVKLRQPNWGLFSHFSIAAERLAHDLSLLPLHQIGDLEGFYLFAYPTSAYLSTANRSLSFIHDAHTTLERDNFTNIQKVVEMKLDQHQDVDSYRREIIRKRHKRRELTFSDSEFPNQWHLRNPSTRMDIDVMRVWENNVTGKGVTVAVVDDGVEWNNPDLEENYCAKGSWDLNDDDPDPMPRDTSTTNHHGTRCAGEIAAVPNAVCAVGVAYGAKVSGLRVLDGPLTDGLEATAFNKHMQINDIYSCSWGPDDDGKTVDGPHDLALQAMKHGINNGRKGYGSIYVVASGNGGRYFDNCNYDGYANSIYTVTIGAVDERGEMPYYAEKCAAMMAVTFSSGGKDTRSIVTTDWQKKSGTGCTDDHTGTSAAAPIAAGMVALMLDVQPCLSWRDIQYLIILSAVKVDDDSEWQENGAGLNHSHKHGFGLMKAWRMVNAAKVWTMVPWLTAYTTDVLIVKHRIPKKEVLITSYEVTADEIRGYVLNMLEHVLVTVNITHHSRGQLDIRLLCPSGTESSIGPPRSKDKSNKGLRDWWFSTVRCWGETPIGTWKLIIKDIGEDQQYGTIDFWKLKLYGTPMSPKEFQKRRKKVLWAIKNSALLDPIINVPCHPPPKHGKGVGSIPLSEKTLKILAVTSVFVVILALYQMFEYMFCYNAEKKEQKDLLLQQQHQRRMRQYMEVDHNEPVEAESLLQQPDIALDTFTFSGCNDAADSSADVPQHIIDSLTPEELNLNFDCSMNSTISDIPSTAATLSEPNLLTEHTLVKDFGAKADSEFQEDHSQSKMPKR